MNRQSRTRAPRGRLSGADAPALGELEKTSSKSRRRLGRRGGAAILAGRFDRSSWFFTQSRHGPLPAGSPPLAAVGEIPGGVARSALRSATDRFQRNSLLEKLLPSGREEIEMILSIAPAHRCRRELSRDLFSDTGAAGPGM